MLPLVLFPLPLFWGCVLLYLRSLESGCWSISDDLSCSFAFVLRLRPFITELVMCTYLLIFKHPSVLLCYGRNLSPGLLRWSSLQNKEGQGHTKFHLVGFENSQTPSTTTVWPIDHREDERSCDWPIYSLVQYDAIHPTVVSENNSWSGMLII